MQNSNADIFPEAEALGKTVGSHRYAAQFLDLWEIRLLNRLELILQLRSQPHGLHKGQLGVF